MEIVDKIVNFELCKDCKSYEVNPFDEPCNECLGNPTQPNSRKPLNFEQKESK